MRVLQGLIGVAIAGVLFRTLIAIGVLEPATVTGRSMAPGLTEGQRIVVDRQSLAWRPPRRWQRVVCRLPDDATKLGVKRVVGLPGEAIRLKGGDVWADGRIARKGLDAQLAVRQLVHRESESGRRWAREAGVASRRQGAWRLASEDRDDRPATIRYRGGLITDDQAINPDVTRTLNPVGDLMLEGAFQLTDASRCELVIARGGQTVRLELRPGGWRVVSEGAGPPWSVSGRLTPRDGVDERRVLFSLFDQQAIVAIDEQPVVRRPLAPPGLIRRPQQLAVRAVGVVEVRGLSVFRDVHYVQRPIDLAPTDADGAWRLGANRWFLVGDNQAVSLDSRSWRTGRAGVPGRLLVGRLAGD